MQDQKLRVLTLNCWGVPVAARRKERAEAIAAQLAQGEFDLAGLQEVWVGEDRDLIAEGAAQGGLGHSHYFHSGVAGSGLMVLSRYPITALLFHKYMVSGSPHRLRHADWYGGKGIGLARIAAPWGEIDFYNSHLVARYSEEADEYKAHRLAQAVELVQFVEATRRSELALVVGDLNSTPESLEYALFRRVARLKDAYAALHPGEQGHTSSGSENRLNRSGRSERIDYVLYRGPQDVQGREFCLESSRIALRDRGDALGPYSDHFGVAASFSWQPGASLSAGEAGCPESAESTPQAAMDPGDLLALARAELEHGIVQAREAQIRHMALGGVSLLGGLAYRLFSERRSRWGGALAWLAPLFGVGELWLGTLIAAEELSALRGISDQVEVLRRRFD